MPALDPKLSGMRWKGYALHLLVAEVFSVMFFASFGSPLAGVMAPVWGLAMPFLTLWDWWAGGWQDQNLRLFLVLSALVLASVVPVVVSLAGRWPKWVGHGGLLVYNAASLVALLALA
jgi:hypothetical protein